MPKDDTIQTILVIGSGPIVIGQAAEFDYAGTQACLALKEEGYKVILVNNNPATIMTDDMNADAVYFEPLTVDVLEKIISKEKPDGLLATLGGQTGLNLAYQLDDAGILEKYKVKLLGTPIDSIKKGEDRELFRELMFEIGEPVPDSTIVHTLEEALAFADKIGFPIIVRPAYTLGGTGGGIADSPETFKELVRGGLQESPITQCLIERSIAGFKEVEYEVMRDGNNTCITICNMENIDPVGIHTGDSIVVAPSQTLSDDEFQMLRAASIKIISALGIIGGCNIQFALDPKSKQYYLIEVNPRVSRSSALASKATGYPIARIAAKLAVGYDLSELINPVTKSTYSSFEPALDYVAVKFPRWPFDKFTTADRKLGTQMKATGEVMALHRSFEGGVQKAVDSLELKTIGLQLSSLKNKTVPELWGKLAEKSDERIFVIFEMLRKGVTIEEIHEATAIDYFFLKSFASLIQSEMEIEAKAIEHVTREELQSYKEKGFSDRYLASVWKVNEMEVRAHRKSLSVTAVYKTVDTCAAEFESHTNYHYSTYFGENEQQKTDKKKVLMIGSGPIRIGQGIEFDYCSVHGVYALQDENVETIMINNNPETVSTDFATADRLYFEPLTLEYVLNVIEAEDIKDVIVQFGGQTAINLAKGLEEYGVNLLGTSFDTLDQLEDRDRFYQLLQKLDIPHVPGSMANGEEQLISRAEAIGFPVLLRPSYVIGGQGMEIIGSKESLLNRMANGTALVYPVLIDSYIPGKEAEIDLIADGNDVYIPIIAEHIEKAGVHSGDSMALLPAQSLTDDIKDKMTLYAKKLVSELGYKGLMNIQFVIEGNSVYVLEVNPRASRTIPIISKVTDVALVQIATKILLGKYSLSNAFEKTGLMDEIPYAVVKYPVFSTFALSGLDSKVGPEMKSTGEGIAIGETVNEALTKVFHAQKANHTTGVYQSESVQLSEDLLVQIKEAGLTLGNSDFDEWLNEGNAAVVLAYGTTEEDKQLRLLAAKYRLLAFTEEETFKAYLQSVENADPGVTSLQEWLIPYSKGVSHV
ncbi:carbamoyl phosphate synthase large subunit [Bacillus sp. AFS026049]|uniref:carbamoyl phosphate synthase large subunit n=1 Tax=Peribacillus frigoritolerans TaxID=450367 RepID=UPI000BEC2B04|nr:carbamoyl phosphate synthase large subunit [Peribacillus frigoritolerans]MBD8135484.1 carbamoyl phosphate synthase large subunit [Bacillus sp. CFBP 13597]MCR8867535.1 carbamoyl phosphate synthase large subunit [Peribacillus frigoritolerans]PEF37747.1 carbamoyl phosphate synthase large subunit [Bacillus sp. AFS094228]PEO49630.1 carbamoyl phosphate synthase large subunit [Bacillus sp. AFS026049]